MVVGGSSFIGRHLLPRLRTTHQQVWATVRDAKDAIAVDGVTWLQTDLDARLPTESWPERCDAVIYLAQSREWRRFPEGAPDVFAVNVRGVFETAEYARRAGATRVIFASTGSVYGSQPSNGEPHLIDVSAPRPFYVASKLSAELLLAPYAALFKIIVLRLFVPYGRYQAPEMLMPQIATRVRNGEPVKLHGVDGLRSNPVWAPDVAEAIRRCLAIDRSVTMNVAGPETVTLRQIAERLGRILKRPPVFETMDAPAPNVIGDTALLNSILDWTPPTTLNAGLDQWLRCEEETRVMS